MSWISDSVGHDVWDPQCVHGPQREIGGFPPVGCVICRATPQPPERHELPPKPPWAEAILPSASRGAA